MSTVYSTWCSCAPGLEKLLAAEVTALGLHPKEIEPGGMSVAMSARQLYTAHLHLSVASRITIRLGRFHASEFWELEKRAERLAWHAWLPKGSTIGFRVTSRKSKLYHNDAIAERLGALVSTRVPGVSFIVPSTDDEESEPSPAVAPSQLFLVRLVNDEVTISADASGDLLYRRGWRQETVKAPLRETLAAAMLTASGWDGASLLHDPFCGAGTIVIEAARRLRNIPPGWDRRFAFLKWPTFDPTLWATVRAEAEASFRPPVPGLLLGTDRDGGAIRASLSNAERAGVGEMVQFAEADMRELPPDASATLVANPPYGVRVGDGRELLPLYAAFGRLAARSRSATFLTPEHAFTKATGLECRTAWRTTNGGIPIECMTTAGR